MTQFYSRNDVNYSGDVYSIPFDYIDKKEVKVYIDDELWTKWHFISEHQLTLDEVPEDIRYSNIISVRRETDIEDKVVTYDNNSLLNKENLNKSQDQLLYAVQEIYDNNTQFAIDIRAEVDEKVERVSDAVEKLDIIDASVETSVQKAQEATEQAQIATEKTQEVIQTYETAMNDIDNLLADCIDDLNSLDATIKKDADAIINRVGFNMFDTVIKDHVLTYKESKGLALQGTYVYKDAIAGSRYGYPDFYEKCLKEREEAIANGGVQKVTLGGTSMSMYIHPNGHMYYDIGMKATVDSWFNTFGTAWFYGVDIENERIFLPRTLWFEQMTNDKAQVGLSVDAGLPNITGGFAVGYGSAGGANSSLGKAIYNSSTVCNMHTGSGSNNSKQLALDASRSSSIYGKSNTVQPNAVKKLLYICVGNTVSDTSWVDVVTQVERGVKDLEDKKNTSIAEIDANAKSYDNLNKRQITNCITEIPQRIKYTLEDGTLTIKAGSVVIVPYGTEDLTSQYPVGSVFINDNFRVYDTQYVTNTIESYKNKFFVWAEIQNDVKLTGAGTATGQCPLMLSITNNSIAFNDLGVTGSGADHTADTKNYTYYNTTLNNVYKRSNTSSAWFPDIWALPLGTFTRNAGTISSLDQVFNGFGYIGSTAWADKGIKFLCPNGRNADGTLNNIERVTKFLCLDSLLTVDRNYILSGYYMYRRVPTATFIQDDMPSLPIADGSNAIWFNTFENSMYYASTNATTWTKANSFAIVGSASLSHFDFKQPFRAVDYNDFAITPHITQTYVNGTSWYRVWSDGWCEQGGNGGNGAGTVTLLKAFINTNYNITGNATSSGSTSVFGVNVKSKTNSSFQYYNANGDFMWRACGYIA